MADISSPRWLVFVRPVGARWQYQPRKDRMYAKKKLSGPDLAQGVALSMVPDGTRLLGHTRGELVLLLPARRRAVGAICTHYGAPLEQGLLVGDTVRCPWHHACFSLRTSEALRCRRLEFYISIYEGARFSLLLVHAGRGKSGQQQAVTC